MALATPTRPDAPTPAPQGEPLGTARLRHVAVGGAVALAVGGAVVLARGHGLLEGWPAAGLVVLLAVALPTSRELSRRVLLVGAVGLGWVPVLWWLPAGPGRATLLLAALAGVVAGYVLHAPGRAARARTLVPRVRAVDALPALAAGAAAVVVLPWLTVTDPGSALSLLMSGWDHSAHYDMVRMQRLHGAPVGQLGAAPLGDTWSYAGYPQGFHSLAATVMELVAGTGTGSAAAEVRLYAATLGVLVVALVVVLAAGLVALPRLRRRPLLAAPAVVLVVAAVLLGPGGRVLGDGFPNFLLAVVLLACLPLLVVPADVVPDPLRLAAVGGALVGIAHGWLLLLVMALPAVLVLLLPLRRRRFRAGPGRMALSCAVVVGTGAAVAVAVLMVASQPVSAVLVIPGAISEPRLRTVAGAVLLAVATSVALAWRSRAALPRRPDVLRVVALGSVPSVGLAAAGAIAVLQVRAGAGLGYYFWKFAIALAVVAVVVAVVGGAWLVPDRVAPRSRGGWAVVGSALACVVASQAFGLAVPVGPQARWAPGLVCRGELVAAAASPSPVAPVLWSAADGGLAPDQRHVLLTVPADVATHPVIAGQWYNAVTGRWTDEANEALKALFGPLETPQDVAAVATAVLQADADTVVILDPGRLETTRSLVGPDLADRILAW